LLNVLKEYIFRLFINLRQHTTCLLLLKLLNLPKTTSRSLISIYNGKSKTLLKDYASLSSKKNYYVFLFLLTRYLLITRTSLYSFNIRTLIKAIIDKAFKIKLLLVVYTDSKLLYECFVKLRII
jgi:hypothetical protein